MGALLYPASVDVQSLVRAKCTWMPYKMVDTVLACKDFPVSGATSTSAYVRQVAGSKCRNICMPGVCSGYRDCCSQRKLREPHNSNQSSPANHPAGFTFASTRRAAQEAKNSDPIT